jgi:hypothetical protein
MPTFSFDISSFIRTAAVVALFFAIYALWRGRSSIRASGEMPYHRLREQRLLHGWQVVFWALVLLALAAWLNFYGEATAYAIFPVSATPTQTITPSLTPSPSLSPTISLTPSLTPTLEFTLTPSPSPIPQIPLSVLGQFTSQVTPNPDAVFSPLTFSRGINFNTYLAINAGVSFANPVGGIYATFSYDGMLPDVQWTAVWYREGEVVYYETKPWDGGTGGYGYSEWIPQAEEWLPAHYQVVIFVGMDAKVGGEFEVTGAPATSSVTPTASPTATGTPTKTFTPTITATHTRFPTPTKTPAK